MLYQHSISNSNHFVCVFQKLFKIITVFRLFRYMHRFLLEILFQNLLITKKLFQVFFQQIFRSKIFGILIENHFLTQTIYLYAY